MELTSLPVQLLALTQRGPARVLAEVVRRGDPGDRGQVSLPNIRREPLPGEHMLIPIRILAHRFHGIQRHPAVAALALSGAVAAPRQGRSLVDLSGRAGDVEARWHAFLGPRGTGREQRHRDSRRPIAAPVGDVVVGQAHRPRTGGGDGVEVIGEAGGVRGREHAIAERVSVGIPPVDGQLAGRRRGVCPHGRLRVLVRNRREAVHLAAVLVLQGGVVVVLEVDLSVGQRRQRYASAVLRETGGRSVADREPPEQVVVGAVLLDDEDDVLDRCGAWGRLQRLPRWGRQQRRNHTPGLEPHRLRLDRDRRHRDHRHHQQPAYGGHAAPARQSSPKNCDGSGRLPGSLPTTR